MIVETRERAKTLEELINKMSGGGYTLNYEEVWRDGRIRPAYVLYAGDRNCSPTAYCDERWYDTLDDEDAAEYLLHLYEEHAMQLDVSPLLSPEYVEEHVLPRVVPASNMASLKQSNIVCRPYLNLAVLYYLPVQGLGDDATVQVTGSLLERVGMTPEEIDRLAMQNLKSDVDFLSMNAMLSSLLKEDDADLALPPTQDIGMWIITNRTRVWGAAVLLYGAALFQALQDRFNRKIAILPSSVHELIAVPYDSDEQLNDFLSMVKEVNATQVAESDLLGDCVYYHDGNTVAFVA